MKFTTTIEDNKIILKVPSDLDSEAAGEGLSKTVDQLFKQGRRTVVLDLSEIEIINSYGVGKLLECSRKLKEDQGILMVKPLEGFLKETFELLRLESIIPTSG